MAGKFKGKKGKQLSRKEREEKKAKVIPMPQIEETGTSDFDAGNFIAEESEHNDQSVTNYPIDQIIEKPTYDLQNNLDSSNQNIMANDQVPKDSLWTKFWRNPWWGGAVLCAFASFISFAQIDSAWADKHHANILWWVLGFIFAFLAIWFLYKTNETSTGSGG